MSQKFERNYSTKNSCSYDFKQKIKATLDREEHKDKVKESIMTLKEIE
jgi:hypothetical protein